MTAVEDIRVQRKGIVIVGYDVGSFVPVDYELSRQLFRCLRSLPIRVVAAHGCYSDAPMQKAFDLVVHMVSSFARLRLRCHSGKWCFSEYPEWNNFETSYVFLEKVHLKNASIDL